MVVKFVAEKSSIPTQNPSSPPSLTSSGLSAIRNVLSSAAPVVATSVFVVLSFVVRKIFSAIFGTKPDLEKIKAQFAEQPLSVIQMILKLIDQNPKKAKETLLLIVKDWKAHPEEYFRYSKDKRVELISKIDGWIGQLCLSNDEKEFLDKILYMQSFEDLKEDEIHFAHLSEEKWEESKKRMEERIEKNQSPEEKERDIDQLTRVTKVRNRYQEIQQKQAEFVSKIVGALHAILHDNHPNFINSNLYCKEKSPNGKINITCGVVIERLIHDYGSIILINEANYNRYADYCRKDIQNLCRRLDGSPPVDEIKGLLNSLHTILSNQQKNRALWMIIGELVVLYEKNGL